MELLAQALLDKEVLSRKDLEELIGPRPSDVDNNPPVAMEGVIDNNKV